MRVHKSIAFTVCFALALATVLVMACSSPEPTPTPVPTVAPTPTPTPSPKPTPTLVPLTPNQVIENAIEALEDAGSLWFVLNHDHGFTEALGGLELQYVEGAINDSGASIRAEANLGRIYIEVEALLIGEDTWFTNPLTGQWELMSVEDNPIGFLDPIGAVRGVLEGLPGATYLVQPTADEDYKITSSIKAESLKPLIGEAISDGVGVAEVVIDHDTFQLKSARIAGSMQLSDTDQTVRIIEISRYGEKFVIEPPTQ